MGVQRAWYIFTTVGLLIQNSARSRSSTWSGEGKYIECQVEMRLVLLVIVEIPEGGIVFGTGGTCACPVYPAQSIKYLCVL